MQIRELSSIRAIPQTEWNGFAERCNARIFQRWEWLAAYEKAYPLKALKSVHHLVGYLDPGGVRALLPLLHLQRDPYWLSIAADLRSAPGEFFSKPYLISPSWYAFYSDVVGEKPSAEYASFIEQAADRIEEICRQHEIPYSVFNAIPQTDRAFELLRAAGYRRFDIMDNTVLKIETADFEGFVKALRSANMRNNIRRYARRLANAGIGTCAIKGPTPAQIKEFYALLVQTFARHGNAELADPEYTIQAVFSEMSAQAELLVLHRAADWVAAALCLVHGDAFYACFPGMLMDESLKPLNLRLNLYCGCIRRALELGCRRVEFGRTGYEFKAKLGIGRVQTPTLVRAYGASADYIYESFRSLGSRQ